MVPLGTKTSAPGGVARFLDRFFAHLEKFAYGYSRWVVFISLVVAGLGIWVTVTQLQFNTNRRDLISKNLEYDRLYQKYREQFEDFDGITVVVEGGAPASMKDFAETLGGELRRKPGLYSEIFYKIDIDYFRDKAFLYMDLPELRDLAEKLGSHQGFLEKVNAAPGLNRLMRAINGEISAGMVDTLMADFLGTESDSKDDAGDLNLLTSILRQMVLFLKGDTRYRSPWKTFLTDNEETLREEGYLVSDDGRLLFLLISPRKTTNDFAGARKSIDTVRSVIASLKPRFPDLQVGVTGSDVIASDEMVTTQIDVKAASIIALAGITLLFIVAYRGVIKPLLAVFSLLVALCWAMGFTTLTVGHLNILSVVFTTILIGLGIDFGIHVLERYREERATGKEILPALQKTLQGTGRGNLAGAITTAIAFGAMTFTKFIGIAELGWIAGGGILLCLVAMILLLPALITIEETRWPRHVRLPTAADSVHNGHLEKFFTHYRAIIITCGVLIVVSSFALRDLQFDYNLLNLQAKGTEAVRYELKILKNDSRSTWYAAVIADSLEDAEEKLHALKALPAVGKIESIVSALPENQEKKLRFIKTFAPLLEDLEVAPDDREVSLPPLVKTMKKIRFKLRSRKEKDKESDSVAVAGQWTQQFLDQVKITDPAQAGQRLNRFSKKLFADYREKLQDLKASLHSRPVTIENLPSLLKKRFLSKNGKYLILVYPKINIWKHDAMQEFLKEIRKIGPKVTGNAVHMFESSQLMKSGYINGGIYAMVAIVLFLLLSFKKPGTTLLILLPTLVGTLWTVGIMDLLDVRFNLANLVILPLIIGIGVVNGIHIVHRYREEPDKNVCVLTRSTGQAVVLSSLTTMIGFGSLMVADHQGIYSLGLVLTLGVGNSLLASVTLLPALLKLCAVKGWEV